MSVIISFATVVLAAFVHASLQLDLGSFLLLHHSLRRRFPRRTPRRLGLFYVLGVAVSIFFALSMFYFIFAVSGFAPYSVDVLAIIVGLLFALAILVWFAYYRPGRTTELWLPRSVSRFISSRADATSSRVESFSLGLLAALAEFPFFFLPLLLVIDSVSTFTTLDTYLALLLYVLIAISPLLACAIALRTGSTVVDVQRWRVRYRDFFRIISGVLFAVLATFVLAFKIFGVFL